MTIHHAPRDHGGHYTFPEGCTDAAVYNCDALTSITFPEGCTHVWVHNCDALTSITFPEGCTDAAVYNCDALTSITFPEGCTDAAVYNCAAYKSLLNSRDYAMVVAGGLIHAGCRHFTVEQALTHWGSASYPDLDRGAKYVAAVNKAVADGLIAPTGETQ